MYKINSLSKGTTIAGLVAEALYLIPLLLLGVMILSQGFIYHEVIDEIARAFEINVSLVETIARVLGFTLMGMFVIWSIVFIINLILFSKMIRGHYEYARVRSLFVWQVIWGAINLLFNQLTAILYLISSISGLHEMDNKEGHHE